MEETEKKELKEMVEIAVKKKVSEAETKFRQEAKEALESLMEKFDLSTRIVAPFFNVSHGLVHLWLGPKHLLPELKNCEGIGNFIDVVYQIEEDCKILVENFRMKKCIGRDVFLHINFDSVTRRIIATFDPDEEKISRLVKHTLKKWTVESDKQDQQKGN